MLLNDAAEGGAVNAHQVGQHLACEVALGVQAALLYGAVEMGETLLFRLLIGWNGGIGRLGHRFCRHIPRNGHDCLVLPMAHSTYSVYQAHDGGQEDDAGQDGNPQSLAGYLLLLLAVVVFGSQCLCVLYGLAVVQGVADFVGLLQLAVSLVAMAQSRLRLGHRHS